MLAWRSQTASPNILDSRILTKQTTTKKRFIAGLRECATPALYSALSELCGKSTLIFECCMLRVACSVLPVAAAKRHKKGRPLSGAAFRVLHEA